MGLIANALQPMVGRRPSFPVTGAVGGFGAPTGQFQYARAYMKNEIVFAAIEMLATSAGEPHIVGRRWQRQSPTFRATAENNFGLSPEAWTDPPQVSRAWLRDEERRLWGLGLTRREARTRMIENGFFRELPDHPLVGLLNNPNPFMSRGQLWGTVEMDKKLAGNAYLYKARGSGPMEGAVAELWRLRPDRVRIIPDAEKFIAGYEYRTGSGVQIFPPEDIMHFKTRHPLDDYYGMPPLMAIADRVNIDEYQKSFLRGFYEHGGTGPASVLTSKAALSKAQKTDIGEQLKQTFQNPTGIHRTLILDNTESTYTQMGLNRGLRDALPKEIDAQTEARIAMAFGIPGSILGLLIGYESSSYANKRQDWAVFWDLTMVPEMSDLDDVLQLSIVPDFGQINEVMFDLSDIKALQEDVDKMHDRWRKDLGAGGVSLEEFREATGRDPDVGEGTFYVPSNVQATPVEEIGEPPEPIPQLPPAEEPVIEARCPDCDKLLAKNVLEADLWCDRCKKQVVIRPDLITLRIQDDPYRRVRMPPRTG